ncbi:MAG: hypothetical protein WAO20_03860 [Acidobacteriota bacterium]
MRRWALLVCYWACVAGWSFATIFGAPTIRFLKPQPFAPVPLYQKFEVDCAIDSTIASNLQWPYDAKPPAGIPAGTGISVDGIFTDPQGTEYRQPGFLYQTFLDDVRNGREWHYSTSRFYWKVRFSPNQVGEWRGKIRVLDGAGTAETDAFSFTVLPSRQRGFIRVSQRDPRYFEFDDGSFFAGLGLNLAPSWDAPERKSRRDFEELSRDGISLVRMWVSSIFGSAWTPYVGGRNRYGGYLPVAGLVPFRDPQTGEASLVMRLDYEDTGDQGWFDACRQGWSTIPEAVKPATNYRISVEYRGNGIEGPRVPNSPYGLVVKFGGWFPQCYEPGTSRPVTNYGGNTSGWSRLSGQWNSGRRNFLPRMYLALENVRHGAALIKEVSIREEFPDGRLGPEIMTRPIMDDELYFPQKRAYALDKIVELAEQSGIYLKLVVMEKGDEMYLKMADDGGFVKGEDNQDGFYGLGRSVNRTRWLQQTWWRYLQARWGYSPSIHSWELTNEGDPSSVRHYELADEFGKYMHCRVFGIEPGEGDGAACSYDHPDDHLVTTSFWHSFPASEVWSNAKYPNLDYADLHAYVSTSFAPLEDKRRMLGDAAYYHLWHSRAVASAHLGKPVVRGEAGLDAPGHQDERVLGLDRDRSGVWLHNFLWSGLDSGGLYEIYWWNSHIVNRQEDHRPEYSLVNSFLSTLDLQQGGYVDWGGTVSEPALRVVGQKNPAAGVLYLWIQNRQHTWRNVVENHPIPPVSGMISIPGFEPGGGYRVEWWDTYAPAKSLVAVQEATADRLGNLELDVQTLSTDVAVTVRSGQASEADGPVASRER